MQKDSFAALARSRILEALLHPGITQPVSYTLAKLGTRALSPLRLAVLALLALAAPLRAQAGDAPLQIRIGYQKSSINLLVAKQLHLVEQRFPGARIEWTEFPAGPQLLEALGAGSLDFGMTGDTPPVFAQAAGTDVIYAGVEPPKPKSSAILVPPDSPVKSVADLKDKRIAFQKGSSAHYLVLQALASAGLKYADIQPVYLAPADARAAFESHSIDAWAIWDPYWAAAEHGTPARVLTTGEGLSDNNTFYLSSRRFAGANPQVLTALFAVLSEADRRVQAQHDQAPALIAAATGLDAAVAKIFLDRRPPSPVTPLDTAVIARQQSLADSYATAGLIPHPIRVADAVWHPVTALADAGAH
jgi:sulfonate transport system substrate-binding protein